VDAATASIKAVRELGGRGTVNPGEALVNAVSVDKPKMLLKNGSAVSVARRLQNEAWTKRYGVRLRCSELTARG
jgi:ribosomal protein S4